MPSLLAYLVEELKDAKIRDLLALKYYVIAGAKQQPVDIPTIRNTFTGFIKIQPFWVCLASKVKEGPRN